MTSRAARRAQAREEAATTDPALRKRLERARTPGTRKSSPLRAAAFLAVVAIVLGGGLFYATNFIFRGGPGNDMPGMTDHSGMVATQSGVINLGISMAGFDPKKIVAKPGQVLTLNWWTTDAAPHLKNGVHTIVSDAMNLHLSLNAQSKKTIQITAPTEPGTYDYWCDSCCGGKDSEDMHGSIVVEE